MSIPPTAVGQGPTLTRQKRSTAQQMAYDALKSAILHGELPAGTRLQQSTLANQLQLSTTPVREALSRLASEGLVQADAHRGAVVRGLDQGELAEIYELRQILEPVVAQKAAGHITEVQLEQAEELWQKMEDISDPVQWAESNLEFHALISSAAHSPRLESIVKGLRDSSTRFVQWSLTAHPQRFVSANKDHLDLIHALRDGDGERAAKIAAHHMSGTLAALRLGADGNAPVPGTASAQPELKIAKS